MVTSAKAKDRSLCGSMKAEFKALKAQLKRVKRDVPKLKKENFRLKTMLALFRALVVISAHLCGKLKGKDVMF